MSTESNAGQRINDLSLEGIQELWKDFPDEVILTPSSLLEIQPQYGRFENVASISPLLLIKPESRYVLSRTWPFVVLLVTGVTTSGKDTLLRGTEASIGKEMQTFVTYTTKQPSPEEAERYQYISDAEFEILKREGKLLNDATAELEHGKFGIDRDSLEQFLSSPSKVKVMRVEPRGARVLKELISRRNQQKNVNAPVLNPFLMREISKRQLKQQIRQKRWKQEYRGRYERALEELYLGGMADLLIINPSDASGFPKQATQALCSLLTRLLNLKCMDIDYDDPHVWSRFSRGEAFVNKPH